MHITAGSKGFRADSGFWVWALWGLLALPFETKPEVLEAPTFPGSKPRNPGAGLPRKS